MSLTSGAPGSPTLSSELTELARLLADSLRTAAQPFTSSADALVVVGTGIQVGQLTVEAALHIRRAEQVFYSVAERNIEAVIRTLNPRAQPLMHLYEVGKPRSVTYDEMVEAVLHSVRAGSRTVAVFYGHPGVFAFPSHEAVRRARAEGFAATMLPGVSAEDCLFADLGVDPADNGCQSLEATDFLMRMRSIDPTQPLILWQVGVVGESAYRGASYSLAALPLLLRKLQETYPPDHPVVLYEAATEPGGRARCEKSTLVGLANVALTPFSTLFVPPLRAVDFDLAFAPWLASSGVGPGTS
jgi:uncharacterized protein YabN with tetrapyrrole methylase and pyrophosphatase domain